MDANFNKLIKFDLYSKIDCIKVVFKAYSPPCSHRISCRSFAPIFLKSTTSMVLRKKGQSVILMKSQIVCMHTNSLGKKGQSGEPNCINCFGKFYWKNVCSLSLHIGLFYLKNLNAYKQFGSSSKCKIGPFGATPSIWWITIQAEKKEQSSAKMSSLGNTIIQKLRYFTSE